MEYFKKIKFSFCFLYSIILLLFHINCDMKIFPDHISAGDPIFNTSQVYLKTNERFIYKLGYYTSSTDNYYSHKYGIYYEPVSCTAYSSSSSITVDNNSNNFIGQPSIIFNRASTKYDPIGRNYFEEISLFKNVITGYGMQCNSHLKVIHNKNIEITYIIPVVSSSNLFTLHIKPPDQSDYTQICNVTLVPNELKIIQIDIKTNVENILGDNVQMVFTCTDSINKIYITTKGNDYFTFIYNKDITNVISLSNFRIIAKDISTKTGDNSNKNLIRSKLGLSNQDSCTTTNSDEECFRGFICKTNLCKQCHYSCSKCKYEGTVSTAKNSCDKCGPLTINEEPVDGECPLNFVDISQFKDISVNIRPYGERGEYNERATIGLWLFFSDLTGSRSLENDIYHIVLENRIVISLVPGDNKITAYCHAFEDLYRKVTSETKLYSSYTDKNSEYVVSEVIPGENSGIQKDGLDIETMNGKWFHVSCGISFEQKLLYIKSVVNGINSIEHKQLMEERLYPGAGSRVSDSGRNDVFFNHIISKGEYLTLSLKNFGNSNAKIYARNLIFFKEYIPYDIQYMFFDLRDPNYFPEMLYQIPFDRLYNEESYYVIGYQYDSDSGRTSSNIPLLLSHADRADFFPPLNFYRLLLNNPNKTYKQIDLKEINDNERDLTISDTTKVNYVYDDDKIINCQKNYFYSTTNKCDSQCDTHYMIYPGVAEDTGICQFYCEGSLKCENVKFIDSDTDRDELDFDKTTICNNIVDYYNLFYKCVPYSDKYYLQYSGFYNSQTIKIDLNTPLQSYIIEFWFYPDFFLQAKARQTQFTFPTYSKNFFFHSNVMDCYFVSTDRLIPYLYDSKVVKQVTSLYNSNEWNKFVIHGKYLKDTDDYIKTVYINHAFNQPITFDASKSSFSTNLTTIIFCENKCQDINNQNIHWTTGYYKDLRIWNGDLASYSEVVQYNDFYPYTSFTKRINSILCYFPLSNQYIANNKIRDLDIDLQSDSNYQCSVSLEYGMYGLKKFNYGKKFDIIDGNNIDDGYYCQHASDPPFIDSCDVGCLRCWEKTFCYQCLSGYFLSGRKCIKAEDDNYYFRSPNGSGNDVVLNYGSLNDGMTISFWTKPIGFTNEIQLMITLGSVNPLKLIYSSVDNPVYGLYLYANDNVGNFLNTDNIVGSQSEFRDNIGKWTFISIAYHKEESYSSDVYYPRMIKFEINTDSIQADPTKINLEPVFSKITISKEYFGLFESIKVYNEFIIQAITFENTISMQSPFNAPDSSVELKCTSQQYKGYDCVPDEKFDLGLFLDSCPLYKDTLTTTDSCMNICSGSTWEKCTCSALNHNSQMIYKNDNKLLCRPLDYINFAKMKPLSISLSSSANRENKCTLQFWFYAYAYKESTFRGITVTWSNHNKIKLVYSGGYKYSFYCYSNNGISDNTVIEINQWVFLSCAVDYEDTHILYINYNTQDNEVYLNQKEGVTGSIPEGSSVLSISDDTPTEIKEWGILFFRQIRLWKNAYFNAEFLSRILIETPTKFPKLMYSWEPVFLGKTVNYQNNFKTYDIVKNVELNVEYYNDYQNVYGMNYIDETKYSILQMCSEDGLYFDVTLKKCLQFLDLSKMKDFTFKDLPSAYSGNFAMAFWIFFEDPEIYRNEGLHINWLNHLQITIKKGNELTGFCLPQGYYSDYENNDDFDTKYSDALNKGEVNLVKEGTSEEGVWIWVICSVSYYERKFFIMGNDGQKNEYEIEKEVLYVKDDGSKEYTSYPMRYYLSDLNNNNMYLSKLSIINISPDAKLYLREILLFRNYIPDWFSERIKYMNLRDLTTERQIPSLSFVANFADFDLETKKLKYIYFERAYGETNFERIDTTLLLSVRTAGSTFELSANFKFQTLCDLNTESPTKYDTETGLCVKINNCVLQDLHATFCMDENTPLSCLSGTILTMDDQTNPGIETLICTSQCIKESFITPGTPRDRNICNVNCPETSKEQTNDGKCPVTVPIMKCKDDEIRIGYKCEKNPNEDISAFFFSKCYNSPNFYRTISTNTLNKITSGYFYEFWIKFDNQLIQEKTCKGAGSSPKEYYLYSTPHSIYKETSEDAFYYQIINSAYKTKFAVNALDTKNWNKIVIETRIETTGQNVYIHLNFEKDIYRLENIDSSITMRLQYISFCSRKSNGDCIPGSSNIMWGSAYYRNIRVWDISSSSIQTIEDYNSLIYTEISKSLVLFYPLNITHIDNNVITELITGEDSISVTHLRSNNFQSDDNVINYNYENNLEWHFKHECTYEEGETKQVLVKGDCKDVTNYYLKVPSGEPVSFDIKELENKRIFTFCIYMKFIGVLKTATSDQPIIFSFKDDTFLVYDIATSYAIFYIGGYQKEAFRDTSFHDYIGIWTPICIANLRSENTYIHPNMFTLSINKIDIPFTSGFSIPKDGISFSKISIGPEIIAYFHDFRIYHHFVQGNFGTLASENKKELDLYIHYPLTCENDNKEDCEIDAEFSAGNIKPCCVGDYNIYDDPEKKTPDDSFYFDINLENDETSAKCQSYCKTLCYNSRESECTCNMTDTVYWLRKNKATSKTYCEHPPYIDYSLFDSVSITVPSSSTNESTLEFWFFIYSYNTTNVNFKETNIYWDKHNRVQIINEKNSLSAKCYALTDINEPTKYSDLVQTISVTAFGWYSIRCGSNINLPTFKYFFNTYEKTINPSTAVPYDRVGQKSQLLISNGNSNPASYGFLFIRELKLWQQYNLIYIDTSYINLSSFGLYNSEEKKSEGAYPGLITLIRSEYSIDEYDKAIEGIYHITNIVMPEDNEDYPYKSELIRGINNIGYNLIDPTNADYYKILTLCQESWVYNSLYNYCEKPSYTKCLYPGDTKDTCMLCPDDAKYIHPVDGLCKSDCPTGYYHRDDMNQCRECNETCYKCNWTFGFNCTECTGARYFVESEGKCVEKCEDYNLTSSNITNNLCTGFDSYAILINYKLYNEEEIDLNTLEKFQAKVINYTSKDYTVLWALEREKTIEKNEEIGKTISLPERSPFIGDLTKEEEVLVDKSFFELSKDYVVSLTVIAHNVLYYDSIVTKTHYFHIRINSYPENGTLNISPSVGLYRTTYFVIKCEGWTDDNSDTKELQYRFFSQEVNTANKMLLRDWSLENEVTTNFSVIYYQQDQSYINIFCEIRDKLNATARPDPVQITIAKSLTGGIYNFNDALDSYPEIPTETKSYEKYNVLLYHRSQLLLSFAEDPYKTVHPSLLQTQYEPTLQGDVILMEDPICVAEYCNYNGDCNIIDEFIICLCNEGWAGKYCQIDIRGQDKLEELYEQLILEIQNNLLLSISWYEFMGIYNLFKGAALFFDNTVFFSRYIETFFENAMNNFPDSIANNTKEYFEILDFYYSYEMMRMEKLKGEIQKNRNNYDRKVNLTVSEMAEFKDRFKYLNDKLTTFMRFFANQNAITRKSFEYNSDNMYLAVIPINPSFEDVEFFKPRKKLYKTHVEFMSCVNYVEMDKLSNQYYQGYLVFIEYNYFPFSFNSTLMENNISPLIELRILDSTTGKFIAISGCNNQNKIIIHMPFYSYRFLDEFNSQKLLYDPYIYKSPDDPIFSDPVYIEENGKISDDTIEQRIAKYSRRYNISPTYYDDSFENSEFFSLKGIEYINFTNDLNFIEFSSTHLCQFTNFMIPNNATYHPNGRFYYLFRPRILKYFPNFYTSMGSLVLLAAFIVYLLLLLIFKSYDSRLTEKEILLDSIKEEIIKNFYPYAKNIEAIYKRLVPSDIKIKDFNPEKKFGSNANAVLARRELITQGEDQKTEKLSLNKFKNEEDQKNSNDRLKISKKRDKLKLHNNFINKAEKGEKEKEDKKEEDKKTEENMMEEIDKEIGNVDRATFNINYLSKDQEKSKEEKDRRVESYSNLKLDACSFFKKNYVLRNNLINAIINVSLFQPRWKKLTMLYTEITIMALIISILLTTNENVCINKDISSIKFLFAYGLAASCASNFVMYFLAIFFQFPYNFARRLFKLVVFNGQLIVMKEWDDISGEQKIKAFFGSIFCIIIWIISLYISLGFTAVWNGQKMDFLISFVFGVVLNFFIMELIVEGIIALVYKGRKTNKCLKNFGFLLNRLRNYRCLA